MPIQPSAPHKFAAMAVTTMSPSLWRRFSVPHSLYSGPDTSARAASRCARSLAEPEENRVTQKEEYFLNNNKNSSAPSNTLL